MAQTSAKSNIEREQQTVRLICAKLQSMRCRSNADPVNINHLLSLDVNFCAAFRLLAVAETRFS